MGKRKRRMRQYEMGAKRLYRADNRCSSMTRTLALTRLYASSPYVHSYSTYELCAVWLWNAALSDLGEKPLLSSEVFLKLTEHISDIYELLSPPLQQSISKEALYNNDPTSISWEKGIASFVMEDVCRYVILLEQKRKAKASAVQELLKETVNNVCPQC